MSTQLFDQANTLCQHIELVLGKLEAVRVLVFDESILSKALYSKDGKKLMDFLSSYHSKEGSKPSMSKNNQNFMKEHGDKMLSVVRSIDYIRTWCHATRQILFKMTEESVEYDIRWNNLFTTILCKLFVAFSKAVIFIFMFPAIKISIYAMNFIPGFNPKTLSSSAASIRDFVRRCSEEPFLLLLHSKDNSTRLNLSKRIGQLISQVGPILIQALGQWPLLNWENFNVFSPRKAADTTYMDLDHVCLANLSLLKETVFFFVLTFPEFYEQNKQFKAIMIAVCSELPNVYLTRQYAVSFKKLLSIYDPDSKTIPKVVRNLIKSSMKVKTTLTHSKRMTMVGRLIKDMTAIASYNPNYLATFIFDIISLCAFASYEIDCALSADILHKETIELINTLVNTAKIFAKHSELVKRTFMYNMTVVDVSYLNQLLNNFSVEGIEWQYHFMNLCSAISQDLTGIDLEEIDRGCKYDFTPLLVTIGRTCTYFNQLKTQHSSSHLQTILEHMNTIVLHIAFATDPLQAFLSFCPIHTFWRHITRITEIAQEPTIPSDGIGAVIALFAFFNLDALAINQSLGELERMRKLLESTRASILKKMYSHLTQYIGKGSRIQTISQQNRFDHLFDECSVISLGSSASQFKYDEETKFKDQIWQMRQLMVNMPGEFEFAGKTFGFSKYIGESITNCLATVLFNEPVPDPLIVDSLFSAATQFLWPLFSLIGAAFPRKLLESKYTHSADDSTLTILQRVEIISTTYVEKSQSPQELAKMMGATKLISLFEKSTKEFLSKGYLSYKYYPHARSFEIGSRKNADDSPFFSYVALKFLIKSLGPHAGFAIDRILINHAKDVMVKIFKIQQAMIQELQVWFKDFQKGGNQWKAGQQNPKIAEASNLMINLGVTLKIREILREATKDVIEIYLPGLPELIIAGQRRQPENTYEKKNAMVIETLTDYTQFYFLTESIKKEQLMKATDSACIFFFFALLLSIPKYNDMIYDSESEYVSYNLHLFPVGLDAFIQCLSTFSDVSSIGDINNCMGIFFNLLSSILQVMRQSNVQQMSQFAFTILVDMFPRSISSIEYGRIGKNFPPSVISEAYRSASSMNHHDKVVEKAGKKKAKKRHSKKI